MIHCHRNNLGAAGLSLVGFVALLSFSGCAAPGEEESLPTTASWCSPICDPLAAPGEGTLARILRRLLERV